MDNNDMSAATRAMLISSERVQQSMQSNVRYLRESGLHLDDNTIAQVASRLTIAATISDASYGLTIVPCGDASRSFEVRVVNEQAEVEP